MKQQLSFQPTNNLLWGLDDRNALYAVENYCSSSSSPRSQEPDLVNVHMNGAYLIAGQSKFNKFSHIRSPVVHS